MHEVYLYKLSFLVPGLVNSLSLTSMSTLLLITITWEPPLTPDDDIIAYEVRYQGEDGGCMPTIIIHYVLKFETRL